MYNVYCNIGLLSSQLPLGKKDEIKHRNFCRIRKLARLPSHDSSDDSLHYFFRAIKAPARLKTVAAPKEIDVVSWIDRWDMRNRRFYYYYCLHFVLARLSQITKLKILSRSFFSLFPFTPFHFVLIVVIDVFSLMLYMNIKSFRDGQRLLPLRDFGWWWWRSINV